MAYYDTLIAAWNSTTLPAGVTGTPLSASMTTAQKLAAINSWTVVGPYQDVTPSSVVAYLALNVKLAGLINYAKSPPATAAGIAASELIALLGMGTNAPSFAMSNPSVFTTISTMLNAVAADPNSGLASADVANLLALAATTMPWWQHAGYTSAFNSNDLAAAGGLS